MARVELGAAVFVHGEPRQIGEVVDVDAGTARYLIDTGKANPVALAPVVIDEPPAEPAPRKTKRTPITAPQED